MGSPKAHPKAIVVAEATEQPGVVKKLRLRTDIPARCVCGSMPTQTAPDVARACARPALPLGGRQGRGRWPLWQRSCHMTPLVSTAPLLHRVGCDTAGGAVGVGCALVWAVGNCNAARFCCNPLSAPTCWRWGCARAARGPCRRALATPHARESPSASVRQKFVQIGLGFGVGLECESGSSKRELPRMVSCHAATTAGAVWRVRHGESHRSSASLRGRQAEEEVRQLGGEAAADLDCQDNPPAASGCKELRVVVWRLRRPASATVLPGMQSVPARADPSRDTGLNAAGARPRDINVHVTQQDIVRICPPRMPRLPDRSGQRAQNTRHRAGTPVHPKHRRSGSAWAPSSAGPLNAAAKHVARSYAEIRRGGKKRAQALARRCVQT